MLFPFPANLFWLGHPERVAGILRGIRLIESKERMLMILCICHKFRAGHFNALIGFVPKKRQGASRSDREKLPPPPCDL